MNMNQKGMDALLSMASKKMGTSSDDLKKTIQSGNIEKLTQGMNKQDSDKLKQVLNNQELTQKIMNSPEAQDLRRKFSNGGK